MSSDWSESARSWQDGVRPLNMVRTLDRSAVFDDDGFSPEQDRALKRWFLCLSAGVFTVLVACGTGIVYAAKRVLR